MNYNVIIPGRLATTSFGEWHKKKAGKLTDDPILLLNEDYIRYDELLPICRKICGMNTLLIVMYRLWLNLTVKGNTGRKFMVKTVTNAEWSRRKVHWYLIIIPKLRTFFLGE